MLTEVTKRDGSTVDFDPQKIFGAIYKANNVVRDKEVMSGTDITFVTNKVVLYIQDNNISTVEAIQDIVEKMLIKCDFSETAKEYILYRAEHNKIRNSESYLMDIYNKLTFIDAADDDNKRENANIDGNTAMGTMLKYGSEGSKYFIDNYVLPKDISLAHQDGQIHIHDKDFYMLTETCCQIDLIPLFKDGFSTGHGYLREPSSIESYSALACIAIQSNQNEMHGGQSIPNFDYSMALGVTKTFWKELKRAMSNYLKYIGVKLPSNTFTIAPIKVDDDYIQSAFDASYITTPFNISKTDEIFDEFLQKNSISNDNSTVTIGELSMSVNAWDKMIPIIKSEALDRTNTRCYQAMEALVHNLCTMSCLPPDEEFWVYDKTFQQLMTYNAELFYRVYQPGRFMALSMNTTTGDLELKDITGVKEGACDHPIVRVREAGGTVSSTTNNHRYLTIEDDCELTYKTPTEDLEYLTMPRGFKIPTTKVYDEIDVSMFSIFDIRENTPYKHKTVKYSKALAELLGYYVGDGHIQKDDSSIGYNFDIKVDPQHILDLFQEAFGFTPVYRLRKRPRINNPEIIETSTMFVSCGVTLGRMFRKLAGSYSNAKHIPDFVLHGDVETQNAFLKGYLICDGCRTKRYIEFSTVSKALAYDMKLLFASRGEMMTISVHKKEPNGFVMSTQPLYTGIVGHKAAERLGIAHLCNNQEFTIHFEIPKYNSEHIVKTIKKDGIPWGDLPRIPRRHHSGHSVRYHELEHIEISTEARAITDKMSKMFRMPITEIETLSEEECPDLVYDISVADNENFMLLNGVVVHNSRAGAQVPFSSLNYGTDTSEEGRLVIRNLLLATEAGLGNGETPIFPVQIFKLKAGVNYNPEDPNYDLFKLAMRTSAKRLFPNFSNLDVPFNLQYYDGSYNSEVSYMGMTAYGNVLIKTPDNKVEYIDISKFNMVLSDDDKNYIKFDDVSRYVDVEGKGYQIYDSVLHQFVDIKKHMYCKDESKVWIDVTFNDNTTLRLTSDHPLPVYNDNMLVRTPVSDIKLLDKIPASMCGIMNNTSLYDKDGNSVFLDDKTIRVVTKLKYVSNDKIIIGYDFETSSDRFDLNNIVSHNCRTRVMGNTNDPSRETTSGRGNLSFTTLNLPRIALEVKEIENIDDKLKKFFDIMDERISMIFRQLIHRFKIQSAKKVKNYPFLMGECIWMDSDKLTIDDTIGEVLRHGTLTIGFIGLAETLISLIGKHHGESTEAQELGLKIVGHIRKRCDEESEKTKLNFSLIATPAESLSGRFVAIDKKKYGIIEGVTDKEYYTNSNHVPVYYKTSISHKVNVEAPYHALCNAGELANCAC